MDPWYSFGNADMLDVAHMAVHTGHMTSPAAVKASFRAVTENAARTFGLDGYGIAPGCHADLVLLEARDAAEAVRMRANRLMVLRRGKSIAQTPPRTAKLSLAGRPDTLEPWRYAPVEASAP